MTAISVSAPFPILTDIDGDPLDAGYVYIGQANLDPAAFPKAAYWDASLTTPAAQPIRTTGGYPVRNGSPARIYTDGDYSIRINNKNGTLVYSSPAATDRMDSAFVGYDGGTVQDVLDSVTGSSGAAFVGYTPAGTGAVATNVQQQLRNIQAWHVNVKDAPFYAKGDGITDDTAAIQLAINLLKASGGGSLLFPPGTYVLSSSPYTATFSNIDLTNAAGVVDSTVDVQLLVQGLHDARLIFDGATLQSTRTLGGAVTICFDGCYNLSVENLKMVGSTVMDTSTGSITTTGTGAIAIISRFDRSSNINFHNLATYNHYTGIQINGDPSSANRVNGVTLSGYSSFRHGYYGLALHNNGDDVFVENLYAYQLNRSVFVYGVDNFDLNVVSDSTNGGFQSVVKAYSRSTTGGDIRFVEKNRTNTQTKIEVSSQHNPALQPTPAVVQGVNIEYYEKNVSGGPAVMFTYYQNSTNTATTNDKLFDNMSVQGKTAGTISTSVVLNNNSNPCIIDVSKFDVGSGLIAFLENTGFYNTKRNVYTPTLTFGGANSGMTGSFSGEYEISDGFCYVSFDITLTAKGTSTGAAVISLPLKVRKDTSKNYVQGPVLIQNGSGIPACVYGYTIGTLTDFRLRTQGATTDAALTDASFTNTTRIFGSAMFPI